jgi:hypothetical protein
LAQVQLLPELELAFDLGVFRAQEMIRHQRRQGHFHALLLRRPAEIYPWEMLYEGSSM